MSKKKKNVEAHARGAQCTRVGPVLLFKSLSQRSVRLASTWVCIKACCTVCYLLSFLKRRFLDTVLAGMLLRKGGVQVIVSVLSRI